MKDRILVTRSSMPDLDEYVKEISSMWDTHWLTNMGPKHKEFQAALCHYLAVEKTHGIGAYFAGNGTSGRGDYNPVHLCIYYPCDCSK